MNDQEIVALRALVEKWRKAYEESLAYDRVHGLRDVTTQLGGMAMAADELDAVLRPDGDPNGQ